MMKIKLGSRMTGAVAIATAFFVGVNPMTAFAQAEPPKCICEEKCTVDLINGDCEVCMECIDDCEGVTKEETEEPDSYGPLTPDGNLELVDDYGTIKGCGKQFITVVTKSGNYFYIIIDRDDNGNENVHFLNMVDEADLLALMDDEEVEKYMAEMETETTEEPVVEPTTEPISTEEPVIEEPVIAKKDYTPLLLVLPIAGTGIIVGYFTLKKKKNKPNKSAVDPDMDYSEDEEEDYLAQLAEDDEFAEDDENE